jgi:hypothetical protein
MKYICTKCRLEFYSYEICKCARCPRQYCHNCNYNNDNYLIDSCKRCELNYCNSCEDIKCDVCKEVKYCFPCISIYSLHKETKMQKCKICESKYICSGCYENTNKCNDCYIGPKAARK